MELKINPKSPNVYVPILSIIFFIIYLITLQPIAAILCIGAFLAYISLDFISGAKQKGKNSLLEIIYAIAGAAIAWLILSALLHTQSPLDVVTSCSMNNVLNRGDLVIVQGNDKYVAPIVRYSGESPNIQLTKTNCTMWRRGQGDSQISCSANLTLRNSTSVLTIPVLRNEVSSNDIIVFESSTAGLVIHRAVLAINNSQTGKIAYLTKGDNNPVVDQEAGLDVVLPEKIHGKQIARIPLIGYLRLFLAGQFQEPRGCDLLIK